MAAPCYVIAERTPYAAEDRVWLGKWGVWGSKAQAHEFSSLSQARASGVRYKDFHVRIVLKESAPDEGFVAEAGK